jgi:hypothetical protein
VRYTGGRDAQPAPPDFTEAEEDLIKNLLPPPAPGGRHRELDMRAVVHAIFSVVDGGIKWAFNERRCPGVPVRETLP